MYSQFLISNNNMLYIIKLLSTLKMLIMYILKTYQQTLTLNHLLIELN